MMYIGIDPGLNGAVAAIYQRNLVDATAALKRGEPGTFGKEEVEVFDTPTMTVVGSKTKRKYSVPGMVRLLQYFIDKNIGDRSSIIVILESVHSMPKQGVSSSFTFGEGLGMWEGIIATLGLSLEMPSPQRWKKEMLADQGKEKDASRFKAMQLFPTVAGQLNRKKDDGRAEALLMAEYGRRLRKVQ